MYSIEIENELVSYLLNKYGKAQHDYFSNETCRSKNPKTKRTNEGLICHHIDEDKAILLSNDIFAINNPYEYQKADRLVYCNILEHLILHIKIVEENTNSGNGINGIFTFICPQINDYFNGYQFKQQYLINEYSLVENNFEDYIKILKYFLQIMEKNPLSLYKSKTKELLSIGWDRQIIKMIYDKL